MLPPAAVERRRQKQATARSGYKLVMLNDDRTPMEFVFDVLQRFFAMDRVAATAAMLHVHHHGCGVAAVYDDREAAASKLAELTAFIAGAGQSLRCVIEPSPS
jgi:ATP-dependent Clp protease adaptor protein ClpS